MNRALLYRGLGRNEEAVADMRSALKLDDDQVTVHLGLGNLLYSLGEKEQALEHMDRALELEPNRPGALMNRGSLRYNEQDYEGALLDFTALIQVSPKGQAYYRRGLTLAKLNRPDEAQADFKQAEAAGMTVPATSVR